VVSNSGEVTKGTGGRSVAPHFVQKMSPVSAGEPYCVQTTFLSGAPHQRRIILSTA
jgi:hypothetical protein